MCFVAYESKKHAEVAELADAHGSGPCGRNTLRVRLPSSALSRKKARFENVLFLFILAMMIAEAAGKVNAAGQEESTSWAKTL